MAEFSDTIGFPFPTSICEKNVRDFPLLEDFQCPGAGSNGTGTKHEYAIDVKGECIIESWMTGMRSAFCRMLKMTDRT